MGGFDLVGISYMDFYSPSNYKDAYSVMKASKNEKAENDEYCNLFIKQNKLDKIFIEDNKSELEIVDYLLEKIKLNQPDLLEKIDYLYFCKNPNGMVCGDIHIPYYITQKYNMKSATVINMFQECATSLQAIEFSKALIENKMARSTMIVTISMLKNEEDRFIETAVLGDGAGIMVISSDNCIYSIEDTISVADGQYSLNRYQNLNYNPMETIRKCGTYLNQFIDNTNNRSSNLKYILPQNLSYSNINLVAAYTRMDIERFFIDNLNMGGHLADVDTVRSLLDIQNKELKSGDILLAYAIGNIRPGMDFVFNAMFVKAIR